MLVITRKILCIYEYKYFYLQYIHSVLTYPYFVLTTMCFYILILLLFVIWYISFTQEDEKKLLKAKQLNPKFDEEIETSMSSSSNKHVGNEKKSVTVIIAGRTMRRSWIMMQKQNSVNITLKIIQRRFVQRIRFQHT